MNKNIKNNLQNKILKEKKSDGMGLLKKAKLIKINDIHNKNSPKHKSVTEMNPLVNLSKEKSSLSKNSSSSKNKINLNIKTIQEKTIDNQYNNEEKTKEDNLNLPTHKRFQSRKNNKRLKELQKYFNDLGINEAYKLYIPQLNMVSPNNNNSNSNFQNSNNYNSG